MTDLDVTTLRNILAEMATLLTDPIVYESHVVRILVDAINISAHPRMKRSMYLELWQFLYTHTETLSKNIEFRGSIYHKICTADAEIRKQPHDVSIDASVLEHGKRLRRRIAMFEQEDDPGMWCDMDPIEVGN